MAAWGRRTRRSLADLENPFEVRMLKPRRVAVLAGGAMILRAALLVGVFWAIVAILKDYEVI